MKNRRFMALGRIVFFALLGFCGIGVISAIAFLTCEMAQADDNTPEKSDNAAENPAKLDQQKKIAALILQLGDSDYFVRQKAQDELSTMGFDAYEALNAAVSNDDLEISTRANYLLKLMRVEWTEPSDSREVKRILKGYEMLDPSNRQSRIHSLAVVPDGKAFPALCRLARYEKTNLLSKQAAMALLKSTPEGAPPSGQNVNAIRKVLDQSNRPAVLWINAWLLLGRDSQRGLDEFKRLIDVEMKVLKDTPDESSQELAMGLMRYYISQLKRLGKNDAVVAAMRQLIEVQKDDSSAIGELAEWFVDQQAWDLLEELQKKFAPRFAADPMTLYLYAEAKLAQNDAAKAEELAAAALKLNPGRDSYAEHQMTAYRLKRRGCIPWAIKEYEQLLAQASDQGYYPGQTALELASLYHDQAKFLEAGKAIEKFTAKSTPMLPNPFTPRVRGYVPKQAKTRMYYYFGCHWESQGDRKKQREFMEKAFKEDPTDSYAVIGFYQLPDLTQEEKVRCKAAAQKVADTLRESIKADPFGESEEAVPVGPVDISPDEEISTVSEMPSREAAYCNGLAWLLAHTDGNLDEAMKHAKRAVELQPKSGMILDTLAHVYFAKGDYETAVKTQEKACELEKHSVLLKQSLEKFKKALEQKK
jgi:tetratricopeptide (TPR) repeat protein